jgi:hypothetical protein
MGGDADCDRVALAASEALRCGDQLPAPGGRIDLQPVVRTGEYGVDLFNGSPWPTPALPTRFPVDLHADCLLHTLVT